MDCGIPYCQSSYGCPVVNLIPEWNDLVYRQDWRGALHRLELTNTLPEVTGRVCPAPCETACTMSINDAPVTIKQIELAIAERGFAEGWAASRPPSRESGKRVAVIGSGPAGLSCAQQLRRSGHGVTVFERSDLPGGLLRYGIPDYKLPKIVIERRLRQMRAEGVEFECNAHIGEDISASYLRRSFDGVVLATGAGVPRDLSVPGRDLAGIHFAMAYLSASNRAVGRGVREPEGLSAQGRRVLVIGGGDTGSDCVGTALRQGALSVTQIEILPRPKEWNEPWNPDWPLWPSILRSSTSHEEGCTRHWSIATSAFEGKSGHVSRAVCRNTTDDQRVVFETDFALLAMGFVSVEEGRLLLDLGIRISNRGAIEAAATSGVPHATSVEGVFCAGDCHTGAGLVVRAIDHGRRAAAEMDAYLSRSNSRARGG